MAWPPPNEALWTACKNGTIQDEPHLHNSMHLPVNNMTMLQIVCKNGHLESAKWLVKRGVYIDACNLQWETAFTLSCKFGHLHVAKWLHANGANIHFADRHNKTPLFNACMLGHLEIAQWLVSVGADIHKANFKGETPLYIACYFNHLHVAEWLLTLGDSVRTRYTIELNSDVTLMYAASLNGNLDVVKWLHAKGGTEDMHLRTSYNGNTALHIACVYDRLEVAQWLVAHGADISVRNRWDNTPLMEACCQNNLKIVKWLWWINPPEISKKTPLTEAFAGTGCGELVMWLLLNGAVTHSTGNVCLVRLKETHPNEALVRYNISRLLRQRENTLSLLFLAVRSRLGDATSAIFDYLGGIRGRQLRIARQINRIYAQGAADL
jgi:ankyrin repeat protein